jgi:hypothetical protein
MMGRVCFWLLVAVGQTGFCKAQAACVNPSTLQRSTVGLVRIFDRDTPEAKAGNLGTAGTAWFLSVRSMVTAGHVAESMHLSPEAWTEVELRRGESASSARVRLWHLLGPPPEPIAVLALSEPLADATPLRVRQTPLVEGEVIASLAYPGRRLRIASGRFMRFGAGAKLAGAALFEMHDGDDRLAIDHGASGAPVIDCEGRAVAVVTGVLSQAMTVLSRQIRVSTAWDTPNVVAAPVAPLSALGPSE